jgi:hypothetical protein
MNRLSIISAFLIIFLIFAGCSKLKEDMLEGTWELINVSDIESPDYFEWDFNNSVLTITRILKSNPSNRVVTDTGLYRLKTSFMSTELRIDNTSVELYNNDWVIIELKKDRFSMKMDIEGGILYREFSKIP